MMANEQDTSTFVFSAGDKYDRGTGAWSRLLAREFVDFMKIQDGESILDVGCGTGNLSLAIAEKTKASKIVGIDLSQGFIDYARGKSRDPRLVFERGDAQNLPYADNSFDRSMAMLVLQFVPDKLKAIAEMKRVTKPGGAIGTALWDAAARMSPNQSLWDAATALDLPADIPSARQSASSSAAGLMKLLYEAGLENITVTDLLFERRFSSLDEYWIPLATGEGVPGKFLGSLSPEHKSAVKKQIRKNLLGDRADGSFTIKARAQVARGIMP
jgi:ubiquinone/menaquinone biosynthesis C-methylase UbiE